MFKELMSILRSTDPIADIAEDFGEMIELSRDLTSRSGEVFFDEADDPDAERKEVSREDVEVNKLERMIRRRLITHLTLATDTRDAAYCLLLMSVVKDIERIGDYAKNLAELRHDGGAAVPDDQLGRELGELRELVEGMFQNAREVFVSSDSRRAAEIITQGRLVNRRCDALISEVARSEHDAATTTSLVLGARYYKRIGSHIINVLSGIVMPLHKLDYFDEDELEAMSDEDEDSE
jgi:phosphate uptake regulator